MIITVLLLSCLGMIAQLGQHEMQFFGPEHTGNEGWGGVRKYFTSKDGVRSLGEPFFEGREICSLFLELNRMWYLIRSHWLNKKQLETFSTLVRQ